MLLITALALVGMAFGRINTKALAVPEVPTPERVIQIGEVVTNDSSATYIFTAAPEEVVYFDEQSKVSCISPVQWKVTDELGKVIFDEDLGISGCGEADAGLKTLSRGGTYAITVLHSEPGTEYQFQIWNVPKLAINIGEVIT